MKHPFQHKLFLPVFLFLSVSLHAQTLRSIKLSGTDNNKINGYFIFKPHALLVSHRSSMSEGALVSNRFPELDDDGTGKQNFSYRFAKSTGNFAYSVAFGAAISNGKFALCFIQNASSQCGTEGYSHETGSLSLYSYTICNDHSINKYGVTG